MKIFLLGLVLFFSATRQQALAGHQPGSKNLRQQRQEEDLQWSLLREYIKSEKEKTGEKAQKWTDKILQAIETRDPQKVKLAIEELLIEDQMFLSPDQEREAFGKFLKGFSAVDQKELVLKTTMGQKEVREKLLKEVSDLLQKSQKPGSAAIAGALKDIQKDHLEAYDRVIQEIKAGNIDTTTTHCFTCGEGEAIGKEGYTFGGAMREAASRVSARFAENLPPAPAPTPVPAPKPQREQASETPSKPTQQAKSAQPSKPASPSSAPKMSSIETKARDLIANPVMIGSRASGNGLALFLRDMKILENDKSLSEQTLRRFLKSGPFANGNPGYRSQIDSMSRDQLLQAVRTFLDGEGPYNHCPSCNLGAGRRLR